MAFSDGRHDYSIKSKENVHCIKEAEAEECLKVGIYIIYFYFVIYFFIVIYYFNLYYI